MDGNFRKIYLQVLANVGCFPTKKGRYQVRPGYRQTLRVRSLHEKPVPSRRLHIQCVLDKIPYKIQTGTATDKSEDRFPRKLCKGRQSHEGVTHGPRSNNQNVQ